MNTPTRGERNNNPCNLEQGNICWQGLVLSSRETRFCTFNTVENGIRAAAKCLLIYQTKHGLKTVRDIINRWAPPHENDTSAYVAHVARVLAVGEDAELNLKDYGTLFWLVKAIILHENGRCDYDDVTIRNAVTAALPKEEVA